MMIAEGYNTVRLKNPVYFFENRFGISQQVKDIIEKNNINSFIGDSG